MYKFWSVDMLHYYLLCKNKALMLLMALITQQINQIIIKIKQITMKFHTTKANNSQIKLNQAQYADNHFNQAPHGKKQKKNLIIKKVMPCLRWSFSENFLYLKYLKTHLNRLKSAKNGKKYKKFQKMSEFIQQKNADQCRSHHQKMIMRFGCLENIIIKLSVQITQNYQQADVSNKIEVFQQVQMSNEQDKQKIFQVQRDVEDQTTKNVQQPLTQQIFDVVDF